MLLSSEFLAHPLSRSVPRLTLWILGPSWSVTHAALGLLLLAQLLLVACQTLPPHSGQPGAPNAAAGHDALVLESVRTEGVVGSTPASVAFWVSPARPSELRLIAANGEGGLLVYAQNGARLSQLTGIQAGLVDVLPAFQDDEPLVLAYDLRHSRLQAFALDNGGENLQPVPVQDIDVADELVGLCSHRSRLSGNTYVYGITDAGLLLHWELYRDDDQLAARLLRSVPVGKGSGFCAVDPVASLLYFGDEAVGIWRLGAEPESDPSREAIDLVEPWGRLVEEVKGIGIYPVSQQHSYLLATDVGAGLVRVYALPDGEYLGAAAIDGLGEAEGLAVTALASGSIAIADEDDSDGSSSVNLISWQAFAANVGLASTIGPLPEVSIAVAKAVLETEVVESYGDAADDPAIWVHPTDPELSLVIGTDKKLGLNVYDLEGRVLQSLPDGRLNNVDVRDSFMLNGLPVSLVVASNRTNDSLSIYRVDVEARRLVSVSDGVIPALVSDPYGLCLYQSRVDGHTYVFVNESGSGRFVQFRLYESAPGRVSAEVMREFVVGSQSEGCVADDETAVLYVGEEGFGVYRYGAEPGAGDVRTLIDSVDSGRLTADVEGLALWLGEGGRGYLVVSNQGKDNFVLYRREGSNEYVGTVHVVADAERGMDGASETDGLEVTSVALGAKFPDGLMVVQDGRNIAPFERQNFKLVSWRDIVKSLDLD